MPDSTTVPVLTKTIGLLRLLAEGTDATTLPRLAGAAGLATTSCYRIVNTLEREGWITKPNGSGGRYRLSTGLLPLLAPLQNLDALFDRLEPVLQQLATDLNLGAKLSVREGGMARTVRRAEPVDALSVTHPVGSRFPLAFGATGAALLASIENAELERLMASSPDTVWQHQAPDDLRRRVAECRTTGVCFDLGSYRPDIAGAAILVPSDHATLAVTVTGLRSDIDALGHDHLRHVLLQAMTLFSGTETVDASRTAAAVC
ncbi:MAG: helix-turn-helix domain-containing protein [Planctomycetota bacterium]